MSRERRAADSPDSVGQGRVELPTSRLSGVRSNHLSYWPEWPSASSRADRLPSRTVERLGPWKLNRTLLMRALDAESPR